MFNDLLRRTNLTNLENFIFTGADGFDDASAKTYCERVHSAEKNISDFLAARFPGRREYDEASECFYRQSGELQDVHFEIGLLLGAKIAIEINKRLEELK